MNAAEDRFLAELQRELHRTVGVLVGAYREAHRVASEHASGGLRSSLGAVGSRGGGFGDPTAAAVVDANGLSIEAAALRRAIVAWANEGQRVVAKADRLAHQAAELTAVQARGETDRPAVLVCEACGLPNPKMRRVDGVPYCASSCFYRVWRGRAQGA